MVKRNQRLNHKSRRGPFSDGRSCFCLIFIYFMPFCRKTATKGGQINSKTSVYPPPFLSRFVQKNQRIGPEALLRIFAGGHIETSCSSARQLSGKVTLECQGEASGTALRGFLAFLSPLPLLCWRVTYKSPISKSRRLQAGKLRKPETMPPFPFKNRSKKPFTASFIDDRFS